MRSLVTIVAALFGLLYPRPGAATPYDLYGAGARSAAMGGAHTAVASGPESLHYNVSRLALSEPAFSVGLLSTFGRARILLKERPAGYDVPDLGPPVRTPGSTQTKLERSDTELRTPLVGLSLGGASEFLVDGLNFGFLVFVPLPTPVTFQTHFADETERLFSNQLHFERLGPKAHHLDISVGVAYSVTEWLAAGIGASYLPGFAVDTGVYLPEATDQEQAELNAQIDTKNGWGFLAGLTVMLPADLTVGVSFRDSTSLRVTSDNLIQLNGVRTDDSIVQRADWTPIYTPPRTAFGIGWAPGRWLVTADVRHTWWANYIDSQSEPAGFRNVVSATMGGEYRYSEQTMLRAGLWGEPTPVPEQVGRTNYVDNTRFGASMGAGHDVSWDGRRFAVAWAIRAHALLTRDTSKASQASYPNCEPGVTQLCDEVPDDLEDPRTGQPYPEGRGLQTGNPGFPGFVSGGWVGSLGVEVKY